MRAWRGLKNFKGQSALSTWLYRIAVNVCLNRVSAKTADRRADRVGRPVRGHPHRRRAGDAAARRARGRGTQGHRGAAQEATRHVDPADVSRVVAPADRRHPWQLGRRDKGQLLSRAGQPEEDPRATSHDPSDGGRTRSTRSRARSTRRGRRISMRANACRQQAGRTRRRARPKRATSSVPEPSPLFWQHLSARVRTAIDAEPQAAGGWREWVRWPVLAPIAALALIVMALAVGAAAPATGRFTRSRSRSRLRLLSTTGSPSSPIWSATWIGRRRRRPA